MNEFVEECRREWRRLRVPNPVADEMAAELAADLAEAETEGASPEDVLGAGARDPRSFAGAWAAERGVVERPTTGHISPWVPAGIAVLALTAIVGAVLLIRASASEQRALAVPPPALLIRRTAPEGRIVVLPAPAAAEKQLASGSIWVATVDAESVVRDKGGDTRTVGAVLSTVSLAGIVLLAFWWLWLARGRRSRRA